MVPGSEHTNEQRNGRFKRGTVLMFPVARDRGPIEGVEQG
jgi:hypothetical protein